MDAGFIQPHEKELMDSVNNGFTKYWMPVNWVFAICFDLRMKGKITADVLLNGLLSEVRTYREKLQLLCNYDWVPVPLAYPQVVFLAVRVYFLLCLVSRQFIITENVDNYSLVDYYFPFMTMLQLIFYMGWLKVAEALLNPLGEDDDDFECNCIIDRNIAIGLSIVDRCYSEIPDQVRDKFEDGTRPLYSEESATMPVHALVGSAAQAGPEVKEHVKMVPHKEDTTSLDHHSLTSRQNSLQDGPQLHKRNVANRIRESLTNRVFRLNRSMSLITDSSGIGSKISPIPSDTHLSKMMSTPTKDDPENGILDCQNHAGLRRGSSADGAIVMAPVARRINSLTDSIQELPQRQQQNGETPSRTLPPPLLHLDTVSEEGDVNNSPTTVSTNTSFGDKKK
ncbi:bestrophin, RFP-TM, chloride channel domain-containing protein [Ditylenchus destructor]|nr:bestrophin, RFP-TM, chloride channel domain-containing protein [Ditylenchus destructor]